MDRPITSQQVWVSAAVFGLLGLVLALPLVLLFRAGAFRRAGPAVTAASALFWGAVAIAAVWRFWQLYYRYLYPAWMRWLAPLDVGLYGVIGLGLWWLAARLPGPPALWFVLLGGVEGMAEHLLGIYGLRILEKVSWLQGVRPVPVLVFSTCEYVVYWALVGWLAWLLHRLLI